MVRPSALVGESGCGKSTVGRAIVNILRAMAYGVEISGKILYHHPSGWWIWLAQPVPKMRPYRSDIQMIFQDPYSSLNPRMTVTQIVEEPLKIHTRSSRTNAKSASRGSSEKSVCRRSRRTAILMNFPEDSGSASGLRALWRRIRKL